MLVKKFSSSKANSHTGKKITKQRKNLSGKIIFHEKKHTFKRMNAPFVKLKKEFVSIKMRNLLSKMKSNTIEDNITKVGRNLFRLKKKTKQLKIK